MKLWLPQRSGGPAFKHATGVYREQGAAMSRTLELRRYPRQGLGVHVLQARKGDCVAMYEGCVRHVGDAGDKTHALRLPDTNVVIDGHEVARAVRVSLAGLRGRRRWAVASLTGDVTLAKPGSPPTTVALNQVGLGCLVNSSKGLPGGRQLTNCRLVVDRSRSTHDGHRAAALVATRDLYNEQALWWYAWPPR